MRARLLTAALLCTSAVSLLGLGACQTEPGPRLAESAATASGARADEPAGAIEPETAPAPVEEPVAESAGTTEKRKPPPCRPPEKFRSDEIDAGNYRLMCQGGCRLFSPSQVAEVYGIGSHDPVEVALRFAEIAYVQARQQAVFEGCLKGFELQGALGERG